MVRSPVDGARWEGAGSIEVEGRTYRFALGTDRGTQRMLNEDAVVADPASRLVGVFDGIGGLASGAEAARVIVDAILEAVRTAPSYRSSPKGVSGPHDVERLRRAFDFAVERITAAACEDRLLHGGGAAAIAGLLDAAGVTLAHAGDCRAYTFRDGRLRRETRDHDLARAFAEAGAPPEKLAEIGGHENVITTLIGASLPCEPDVTRLALGAGDRFILVSDGIHRLMDDAVLATHLGAEPSVVVHALLDEVARRGADNAAVAVVDVVSGP